MRPIDVLRLVARERRVEMQRSSVDDLALCRPYERIPQHQPVLVACTEREIVLERVVSPTQPEA
jgi:hypothetical protein